MLKGAEKRLIHKQELDAEVERIKKATDRNGAEKVACEKG